MATSAHRDFVVCYYCHNEATEVVDVSKSGELLRRWVCEYHAARLPTRRRLWPRRSHAAR
jgi:hypothetical protein